MQPQPPDKPRSDERNNQCVEGMTWQSIEILWGLLNGNHIFSGFRDAGYDKDDYQTYALLATVQESFNHSDSWVSKTGHNILVLILLTRGQLKN